MSDCPATFLKHWHVRVVDPVSPQLLEGQGDEVQPGAYVVHGHIGMHAGNAVVTVNICLALANLAAFAPNHTTLTAMGGVDLLVAAHQGTLEPPRQTGTVPLA